MTVVLERRASCIAISNNAIGSVEVPMTDQQLETKILRSAEGILPRL